MIVASSNATIPNGGHAEFRLHKYHSNIADVIYLRPSAGHTGAATLRSFLEDAKNRKYYLCVTLNLRDDLGGKKFAIRPINEYVDAARQVSNLFKQYNIKGFVNLFSEPVYRYKMTVSLANQYINAVKFVIGDIPLGAGGEDYRYLDFLKGIAKNRNIDILTFHNNGLADIKSFWDKKFANLETSAENTDSVQTANYVYNLYRAYHDYGAWWLGYCYVDSWTDRNLTARWWDYNYTRIEYITPTYSTWLNARRDFMEGFKLELVKPGSKNEETRAIQQIVNNEGANPPLVEDGIYGNKTKEAILKWQTENGLIVDGIVGKQTWQWILENIPSGELRFQQMLIRKGFQ